MSRSTFSDNYSIITFAANKITYVQFALYCARSVLLHNNINIYIISNLDFVIPDDIKQMVHIVPMKQAHAVLDIGMKMYMDEYLQTEHTLFIDSDCLVYDGLGPIFNACKGKDVSVAGISVPVTEWCGREHAQSIIGNFGLEKITRFNGGLYYLNKTDTTTQIFAKARKIASEYNYGYDKLTNKMFTEEIYIAIAMAIYHQLPIADDGTYMTDMFTDQRPSILNVLKGERVLSNQGTGLTYRPWYPLQYSPIVLHFGGNNISSYPYISQALLLRLSKLPVQLINAFINVFVNVPYKIVYFLKTKFKHYTENG